MLYSEKVMDHFTHPRNVGTIENADGVGEVGNAKCGDIMKIYLKTDKGSELNGILTFIFRKEISYECFYISAVRTLFQAFCFAGNRCFRSKAPVFF